MTKVGLLKIVQKELRRERGYYSGICQVISTLRVFGMKADDAREIREMIERSNNVRTFNALGGVHGQPYYWNPTRIDMRLLYIQALIRKERRKEKKI